MGYEFGARRRMNAQRAVPEDFERDRADAPFDLSLHVPEFLATFPPLGRRQDGSLEGGTVAIVHELPGRLERLLPLRPPLLRADGVQVRRQADHVGSVVPTRVVGPVETATAHVPAAVVDLQDGGGWDWSEGEPPKTNPAYYLRFCKSFARMGLT